MTGPSGDPLPAAPPPTQWGPGSADAYAEANLDRFTPEAIVAALVAAGYDPTTAAVAVQRGSARRQSGPTRASARRIVIAAYLLTYAVLAFALVSARSSYGAGPIAAGILALVLGVAFVISAAWLRRQGTGTLWVMLSMPLILLVLVGGACYATTLSQPGAI